MTPNPEHSRYRIYRLEWRSAASGEAEQVPVEVARTSRDGIGLCLVTLREEEQITALDAVGILDRLHDDEQGTWIVNPYGGRR